MATHAQLASKLLRDAATFFRNLAEQNPGIADQMEVNAQTYERVADLTELDPHGELPLPSDQEATNENADSS